MKTIVHNLGLGDHIICAPIVARMASETSDKVVLPCWVHNKQSVESFFVNYPNVFVVPIEKESQLKDFEPGLRLGHYSDIPRNDGEDFISWFYRQADFPLEERDKWCPLHSAAQVMSDSFVAIGEPDQFGRRFQDNSPFIFKHDDSTRGYVFRESNPKSLPVYKPHDKGSIFVWYHLIKTATEIHCIDSSFLHLADALPTTGRLYFHRYARSGDHNKNLALRKKWEILE